MKSVIRYVVINPRTEASTVLVTPQRTPLLDAIWAAVSLRTSEVSPVVNQAAVMTIRTRGGQT